MLTASGITKRYGAVQALVETNLVVRSHEVVALVGDNGAGKSTLIKWRRAASSTGTVIDPERRQHVGDCVEDPE